MSGKTPIRSSFIGRNFRALWSKIRQHRHVGPQNAEQQWANLGRALDVLLEEGEPSEFIAALKAVGCTLAGPHPANSMGGNVLQRATDKDLRMEAIRVRLGKAGLPQLLAALRSLQGEDAEGGLKGSCKQEAIMLFHEICIEAWSAVKLRARTAVKEAMRSAEGSDLEEAGRHLNEVFAYFTQPPAAAETYVGRMAAAFWSALPEHEDQRALILLCVNPENARVLASLTVHRMSDSEANLLSLVAQDDATLGVRKNRALADFLDAQQKGHQAAETNAVLAVRTFANGLSKVPPDVDLAAIDRLANVLNTLGVPETGMPPYVKAELDSELAKMSLEALMKLAAQLQGMIVPRGALQVHGAALWLDAIRQLVASTAQARSDAELKSSIVKLIDCDAQQRAQSGGPVQFMVQLRSLLGKRESSGCWPASEMDEMRQQALFIVIDHLDTIDLTVAKGLLVGASYADGGMLCEAALTHKRTGSVSSVWNWWAKQMASMKGIDLIYQDLSDMLAQDGATTSSDELVEFAEGMTQLRDVLSEDDIALPERCRLQCAAIVVVLCTPGAPRLRNLSDENLELVADLCRLGRLTDGNERATLTEEKSRRATVRAADRMSRIDELMAKIRGGMTALAENLCKSVTVSGVALDFAAINQLATEVDSLMAEVSDDLQENERAEVMLRELLGQMPQGTLRMLERQWPSIVNAAMVEARLTKPGNLLLSLVSEVVAEEARRAALAMVDRVERACAAVALPEVNVEQTRRLLQQSRQAKTTDGVIRPLLALMDGLEAAALDAITSSLEAVDVVELQAWAEGHENLSAALATRAIWLKDEQALAEQLRALVDLLSSAREPWPAEAVRTLRAVIDGVAAMRAHYTQRQLPVADAIEVLVRELIGCVRSGGVGVLLSGGSDEDLMYLLQVADLIPGLAEVVKGEHARRLSGLRDLAETQGEEVIRALRARIAIDAALEVNADSMKQWPQILARLQVLDSTGMARAALAQGMRKSLGAMEDRESTQLVAALRGIASSDPRVALFQEVALTVATELKDARLATELNAKLVTQVRNSLLALLRAPGIPWSIDEFHVMAEQALAPRLQQGCLNLEGQAAARDQLEQMVVMELQSLAPEQLRQIMLRAQGDWTRVFGSAGQDTAVGAAFQWYVKQEELAEQLEVLLCHSIDKLNDWIKEQTESASKEMVAGLLALPPALGKLQQSHKELGGIMRTTDGLRFGADLPEDLWVRLGVLSKTIVATKDPSPLAQITRKDRPALSEFFAAIDDKYADEWRKAAAAPELWSSFTDSVSTAFRGMAARLS